MKDFFSYLNKAKTEVKKKFKIKINKNSVCKVMVVGF